MPKSYLICHSEIFYQDEYMIPIQCYFFEDEIEGAAETFIKPNKKEFHAGFDQYFCHHDFKHKKRGKVFNKNFSYFWEPIDFYTYYNPINKLTLVGTKTEVSLDYIKKLNGTGYFDIKPVNINFEKMIPKIDEMNGAWFANLKKAHLKTAAFFGPHVNKSDEYKEAAKEGNISSINIYFINNKKKEYSISISQKGSIVLYDHFATIEEELDLVLQIYERLIKPHITH